MAVTSVVFPRLSLISLFFGRFNSELVGVLRLCTLVKIALREREREYAKLPILLFSVSVPLSMREEDAVE